MNEILPIFEGHLHLIKYVVKQKKKFLWMIPYNSLKHYWVVGEDFSFYYRDKETGLIHKITVKKGFRTDLASVPKLFRGLFSVDGPYAQPAVLHDFIYAYQGVGLGVEGDNLSRSEGDYIFLIAMIALGVSVIERQPIYRTVRIGGWYPWSKSTDPKSNFEEILDKGEV